MPFKRNSIDSSQVSAPTDPRPIDASQPLVTQPIMPSDQAGSQSQHAHDNTPMAKSDLGPFTPHPKGLISVNPDPKHVAQPNANQPSGAFDVHDPKSGKQAGELPDNTMRDRQHGENITAYNTDGTPVKVIVEKEKVPFKDQVKGWQKIHQGTILRDAERKEEGKKILAGEITPPSRH